MPNLSVIWEAKMESNSLAGGDCHSLLSAEIPATENPRKPGKNVKDLHILSFMFFLIFLAYGAAQNLESSVNSYEDLGTTSLGILYTSFTVCSFVASHFVRKLGSKNSLIVGTTGYWLFIAANIFPSWYTMVPASLYLGFTASLIWVAQATYLTCAARSHAAELGLPEGSVLGSFNGEFWGAFSSTQVIGNLLTLAVLQPQTKGKESTTALLFVVFLGSMTVGTILGCFLSKQYDSKAAAVNHPMNAFCSVGELIRATFIPFLDKKMLFLIPLLVYSGLEQAFVWAEFTKYVVSPAIGVQGVGGAMAVFGAADVISSVLAGRLTKNLLSITIITFIGIICQAIVLFRLWFNHSFDNSIINLVNILWIGVLWGIGDGVLNTQINAALGLLFPEETEAVFSQLKIWQSGAIAFVFFISPHIAVNAMLLVLAATVCIAFGSFLTVTQIFARGIEEQP